jgi:hypothetical protein
MRRETQDGFRQRLRQEGRFQDFSARRKDLQAEGLSPSESWDRAAAEFGFGEPHSVAEGGFSSTQQVTSEMFQGRTASLQSDFGWVYENQAVEDVRPENAPSSGAWGLLQFARMEPRAFYTEWLRMVARQEDEFAEDRRFVEAAQISR